MLQNEIASKLYKTFSDNETAIKTIEVIHERIHNGYYFYSFGSVNIPSHGTVFFHGKVGSRDAHICVATFTTDNEKVTITQFENPTITNQGVVEATIFNANRGSTNTTDFKIYADTTINEATGTITNVFNLRGAGVKEGVSLNTSASEFIQPAHYNYVLKIYNNGAQAVNVDMRFEWYEA